MNNDKYGSEDPGTFTERKTKLSGQGRDVMKRNEEERVYLSIRL